jgi:hypothetical protein
MKDEGARRKLTRKRAGKLNLFQLSFQLLSMLASEAMLRSHRSFTQRRF